MSGDVVDALARIEATLDGISDGVDDLQEGQRDLKTTIAYLHREEFRDDPAACDRLGVDVEDLRAAPDGGDGS